MTKNVDYLYNRRFLSQNLSYGGGGGGGQYIYGSIQKDGGIRLFLIKTRAPHILRPFHPSELASCEAAEIQATLRTKRLQKGKSFHE